DGEGAGAAGHSGRRVRGVLPGHLATAVPHDVRRGRRPAPGRGRVAGGLRQGVLPVGPGPGRPAPGRLRAPDGGQRGPRGGQAPVVPRRALD
ncbi:MAG: hypothetical protein AVDCRST_MAG47-803, partial [uncultured Nocardioidaceae bacterium]